MRRALSISAFLVLSACNGGTTPAGTDAGGGGSDGGDPLVAQCTTACDLANAVPCGSTPMDCMCPAQVAAARAAGCAAETQGFFDCIVGASDVCAAFMGTAGPCGGQYTAFMTCTMP